MSGERPPEDWTAEDWQSWQQWRSESRARAEVRRHHLEIERIAARSQREFDPAPEGDEAVARGTTIREICEAAARDADHRDGRASIDGTAELLHMSASTLKRAMRELGAGSWPPPRAADWQAWKRHRGDAL